MYSSQQHTYSKNYNNYITTTTLSNELFFIEKQKLVYSSIPTVHQQHDHQPIVSTSPSAILFESILLPTMGHTTLKINNNFVSFFGKPDQPPVTTIQTDCSPPSILSTLSLQQQQRQYPPKRYAHTTTMVQSNNKTTIFLIGGSTAQDDRPLFDIWKLEWDTKKWINLDVQTDSPVPGLMGHVTLVLPRHRRRSQLSLLTCFGTNHRQELGFHNNKECALFNTDTLTWKPLKFSTTTHTPAPRLYASMIPTNDTHAVLYGGQSTSATLLDDLWWLHLDDIDTEGTVTFTPLGHSAPRAGHTASMVSENLMVVYGGQSSPELDSSPNTVVVFDLEKTHWELGGSGGHSLYQKRQLALETSSVIQGNTASNNGLGGGVIGGIVVAILLVLGLSVTLFVLYQRRKRRQRNYNLPSSQGSRFSLATPPPCRRPHSGSDTEQAIQQPIPAKTRLSHMSFGSEFGVGLGSRSSMSLPSKKRTSSTWATISTVSLNSNTNHPNQLDSPSRQLYTNWICETPIPPSETNGNSNTTRSIDPRHTSMYVDQSISQHPSSLDNYPTNEYDTAKKGGTGSGTTLDRLRLSIFKPLDILPSITEPTKNYTTSSPDQSTPISHATTSNSMQDQSTNTSKRRSTMFGLSKLLNLGDSSTTTTSTRVQQYQQDMMKKQQQLNPRESLGSKSVASLQWVEFNSDMDFNGGNHWTTQRHLTVMNHRQSSATISSGSGISSSMDDLHARTPPPLPASPRDIVTMAQQLQQQHRQQQQQQHTSYRLNQRELQSWEDDRLSRLVPPSPRKFNTAMPSPSLS